MCRSPLPWGFNPIRTTQEELGDVTIEEAWGAVELVEREKFETDVSHLRPMVFVIPRYAIAKWEVHELEQRESTQIPEEQEKVDYKRPQYTHDSRKV
jgi:hypothetical protein